MMDFESAAAPYLPIRRRLLWRRRLTAGAIAAVIVATVLLVRHHLLAEPIGERIFDQVTSTIAVRYYDRSYHGLAWNSIVDSYRPKVIAATTEAQRYRLLSEMIARLGDSHTAIFSPSEVAHVQDQVAGQLGAAFVSLGHDRVVARVAPRSPAASAGLRPGMIVATHDGASGDVSLGDLIVRDPLTGRTWRAAVKPSGDRSFDDVEQPAVDWGTAAPGIAYVRMASFPNDIQEELAWAISESGADHAMVLDLRGNPGGLIDAVDATAGIFLAPGTLVVSGTGRYPLFGRRRFAASDDAHVRYGGRLAVIVNEHSESGAEALASALQIYHRAVIVGQPTARHVLGVEVEEPLADGGLLRVATLDMRDADGAVLEGKGVTPDIIVARTPTDVARGRDPQLRAALAAISGAQRP